LQGKKRNDQSEKKPRDEEEKDEKNLGGGEQPL